VLNQCRHLLQERACFDLDQATIAKDDASHSRRPMVDQPYAYIRRFQYLQKGIQNMPKEDCRLAAVIGQLFASFPTSFWRLDVKKDFAHDESYSEFLVSFGCSPQFRGGF
jgi:hypothetical protein